MKSDYGVMGAVYQALSGREGTLKIFHYVPQGVMPPYAVLELMALERGNSLPPPHFQTRGEMTVRVWSAYEGLAEVAEIVGALSIFFDGKKLDLPEGPAWFDVTERRFSAQQSSAKNPWREGSVTLRFVVRR